MKSTFLSIFAVAMLGLAPGATFAGIATFSDKSLFLNSTGAFSATGALPNLGLIPGGVSASQTVGDVTFSIAAPSTQLYIGSGSATPMTRTLPGNVIGISGIENLNAAFQSPVFSAGFDFVEPSTGGDTTGTCYVSVCSDSTFTVTLKNNGTTVSSFMFNAPDDVAAFVGVWSDQPFNAIEIRDATGTIDNEFFGQFYSGQQPLSAIPEPESIALMLAGLGLLGLHRRKGSGNVSGN
ncbi:PEP-CTERM sorting domain-containing protein [Massilia sp. W12]|uniref:PEP-CTERM sorting domain-containing protein n=1 Tax=Massilia sp. W12 TaxID=3126507 RepID=UPI0030CB1D2F